VFTAMMSWWLKAGVMSPPVLLTREAPCILAPVASTQVGTRSVFVKNVLSQVREQKRGEKSACRSAHCGGRIGNVVSRLVSQQQQDEERTNGHR